MHTSSQISIFVKFTIQTYKQNHRNSYVFGTSNLDSDISYNRQLFVGGEGIKDNGSEIINSTFITNSQIGAGNAMIDWIQSVMKTGLYNQIESGHNQMVW